MNESNEKTMYEGIEAVRNLNKVEGFNPKEFMREIQGEGESRKYYLDVAFRKLWFRLKHPDGRISKRLIKLNDDMAVVEARIYLSFQDAEENYIANAFSHKFRSGDAQFGSKFVELAETAAVGRALSDAGFGLQFADCEKETDPEVTEAPIESKYMGSGAGIMEDMAGDMDDAGTVIDDNNLPGQLDIGEYIQMPEDVGSYLEQTGAETRNPFTAPPMPAASAVRPESVSQPAASTARPENTPQPANVKPYAAPQTQGTALTPQEAVSRIDRKLPAEQIYTMLTREMAAAVVVNVGYCKGKTLGQIALEKPGSLDWYVTQYNGPDNLLRAAAKFFLDVALRQAG